MVYSVKNISSIIVNKKGVISVRRCNEMIREKMKACGLKNKDVAERVGVTANSFSRILNRGELLDGRRFEVLKAIRELAREKAERLAYAFEDVTVDELFSDMWGQDGNKEN